MVGGSAYVEATAAGATQTTVFTGNANVVRNLIIKFHAQASFHDTDGARVADKDAIVGVDVAAGDGAKQRADVFAHCVTTGGRRDNWRHAM